MSTSIERTTDLFSSRQQEGSPSIAQPRRGSIASLANITKFLKSMPLSAEPEKSIITIMSDESADKAFLKLAENNILAAPIVDSKTKKAVGVISKKDFCAAILDLASTQKPATPRKPGDNFGYHHLQRESFPPSQVAGIGAQQTHPEHRSVFPTNDLDMNYFVLLVRELHSLSAVKVEEFGASEKMVCIPQDKTTLEVVQAFAQGSHWSVICESNENQQIKNFISQSYVMNLLAKNVEKLGSLGETKVGDLGIGQNKLICVREGQTAYDAYRIMLKENISGLAIVKDMTGGLVASLSYSDLKGLGRKYQLPALFWPLHQFVTMLREDDINVKNPTICCHLDTPLKTVILKMVAAKIHRIFVVEEESFIPKGVISATDIMKVLVDSQ